MFADASKQSQHWMAEEEEEEAIEEAPNGNSRTERLGRARRVRPSMSLGVHYNCELLAEIRGVD